MTVACDDSLEPSTPQYNPQNPILASGDIEVAPYGVLASDQVIALATYDDPDNSKINVLNLEKADSLVSNAEVILSLEISKTEDFAKYETLSLTPSTEEPTIFYADSYEWNALQLKVFGNSVKPQKMYYRVPVNILIEETSYRYMGPNYFATEGTAMVSRMNPGYQLDENYYIFGSFIGGNTPGSGIALAHDDRDVYDNPNFSYAFVVSEDDAAIGYSFMIAPQAVHDSNGPVSECYGQGEEEGVLVIGGDPINVTDPGPYMLEVNMLDLTYTLKIAPESLYVIFTGGQFNKVSQLSTSDYVTYEGVAGLTNKWALAGQANYRPTLYVNNPEVAADNSVQFTTTGGIMYSDGGATAANENGIAYSGAGLYYIKANLQELTYNSYFCKTMGITGSMEAQNWGAGADVALTSKRSDLYLIWTGTLTVNAGDEWKIRANSDWAVNFGSAGDGSYVADGTTNYELAKDGANFVAPEAGTYTVTVYFNGMTTDGGLVPYYMTVAPK